MSRKHRRESKGGKGQGVGAPGGMRADRQGQGIKTDGARMSREHSCETGWAQAHLPKAKGTARTL